jgi:hypothetical protein
MSVSLTFIEGDNIEGFQATAWNNLVFPTPIQETTISDGIASFSEVSTLLPLPVSYAVASEVGTVFRSGLESSPADQQFAIFRTSTLVGADSPDPSVIAPTQLQGMLPQMPTTLQDSGDVTITLNSGALVLGTDQITLTGNVTYVQRSFGTIQLFSVTGEITYEFTLSPFTVPWDLSTLLVVDELGFNLSSDYGGPVGWIANAIVSGINNVFGGLLAGKVTTFIQAAVDIAIADSLSNDSIPAGTTLSSENVTIDPVAGLDAHVWATLPASVLCPSGPTSGSVRLRSAGELTRMRAIRDHLLGLSPQGRAYVSLFYEHGPELTGILVRYPNILRQADTVVAGVLRDLPVDRLDDSHLSEKTLSAISDFLDTTSEVAKPALRRAISAVRPDLNAFVGVPVAAVLAASSRKDAD